MSAPATRVAAVILAAGEGRRFGGPKLLTPLDGKPLLQHVVEAATGSSLAPIVLVVGHAAAELLAAVRPGAALIVRNDDYATGQASSLRAGLRAVSGSDAAVVLLGDQPRVTSALLDALAERQRTSGAAAVISSWNGRRSPPTLLHRDLWPAVEALSGDVGARAVLAGRDDVALLEVDDRYGALDDVDTREDLARLDARRRS